MLWTQYIILLKIYNKFYKNRMIIGDLGKNLLKYHTSGEKPQLGAGAGRGGTLQAAELRV